jgi:hypothetical protein
MTLFMSGLLTPSLDASPLYDCDIGKSSNISSNVHLVLAESRVKF